jgi:hypothetical protein
VLNLFSILGPTQMTCHGHRRASDAGKFGAACASQQRLCAVGDVHFANARPRQNSTSGTARAVRRLWGPHASCLQPLHFVMLSPGAGVNRTGNFRCILFPVPLPLCSFHNGSGYALEHSACNEHAASALQPFRSLQIFYLSYVLLLPGNTNLGTLVAAIRLQLQFCRAPLLCAGHEGIWVELA